MDARVLDDLRRTVPAERVTTDVIANGLHAHDWWPKLLMQRRAGQDLPTPDVVVAPADRDELVRLVTWCHDNAVAIVPFGAGTGVCGGAAPVAGAITIDLKPINRILAIDEVSGTVTVEPGVIGQALEDHLNERGWTLGHFPSSIHCSTIGGFLAVRSAGQASSFYGKLEDAVVALEVVLPDGHVFRSRELPQGAVGPDLNRIFLGSEGTMGIISEATLRIWPKPEVAIDRGFLFPDVASGLAACRELLRTGLRPHIFRLYDQEDTALVFGSQGLEVPDGCLMIVGAEGEPEIAAFVAQVAFDKMIAHGGTDLGAGPGEHWRAHRHSVSYRFADYMKPGGTFGDALMLDTMEVASTWSRIETMYADVKAALSEHCDLVLAHFSHVYPEGASIYFSFGGINDGDEERAMQRYDAAWAAGQTAAIAAGGTGSHHHGVGLLRAPYVPQELGEVGWDLLQRLKAAIDPQARMNPGKLGLGGEVSA